MKETLRQVYFSGWWLEDELKTLGCNAKQVEDLCFAHGQHCFGRDPWTMAQFILQGYKDGNPEKPGPELAERICKERLRIVEE